MKSSAPREAEQRLVYAGVCDDFVSECQKFLLDSLGYFNPVKTALDRCDTTGITSFDKGACTVSVGIC